MNNKFAANELVDIIREIVADELNKRDNTVLCEVVNVLDENHVDVYVVPDQTNLIHNIVNSSSIKLNKGDFVYVLKVNNQFTQAFVISKIIPYTKTLNEPHIVLNSSIAPSSWSAPIIDLVGDILSTPIVAGVTKYKIYSDNNYIGYIDPTGVFHRETN